jgi:hypothetical protein
VPSSSAPRFFPGLDARTSLWMHPLGALQAHRGAEPATVQAQHTSSADAGIRVGATTTRPRQTASKHREDSSQTRRESHSPLRPPTYRDRSPDPNRRPLRAVPCPPQPGRGASDLSSPAADRRAGGEQAKSSQPSPSLPPPYRLGGLRPGPALLPTALFPHVGS